MIIIQLFGLMSPPDSAHCLEDQDRTFGSGLTWQDTLADRVDIVSCPPGIIGKECAVQRIASPTLHRRSTSHLHFVTLGGGAPACGKLQTGMFVRMLLKNYHK